MSCLKHSGKRKRITNNMKTEILKILNPVHLPTVAEWDEIAQILFKHPTETTEKYYWIRGRELNTLRIYKRLQQRFEELTRGKWIEHDLGHDKPKSFQPALLRKEMFVCEVEMPIMKEVSVMDYDVDTDEGMERWFKDLGLDDAGIAKYHQYNQALSKVWFDEFESSKGDNKLYHLTGLELFVGYYIPAQLWINDKCVSQNIKTVFDFIIELDRYNRTASTPIQIQFTENFVEELIK